MKMKILALCLCFLLAASLPGFAQPASLGYETEGLERYSSFVMDKTTGEWTVSDPLFTALCDAVAAGEVKNYMKDGVAVFQLRLSGNVQTGTIRPEMEIDYIANGNIGVQAVSILTGGVRYDFRAKGTAVKIGGYPAEQIVLPLEGAALAETFAAAEEMTVVLHGTKGAYTAQLALSEETKNAKDEMEQASLRCGSLLKELDALNIGGYALWDLSRAEWENALGFAPECTAAETDALGLMSWGDKGDEVQQLQQLLASAGFYAGEQEREYEEKTAAAVARAQEFYGLTVTGSADHALVACLRGESAAETANVSENEAAENALGNIGIGVHRWWQAQRVNASENASAQLLCADSSNIFLVAEGTIANRGDAELGLGWDLTAELVLNGSVRYQCTLRAESEGGAAFAGSLLPLAHSRLVAVAELPKGALDGAETAVLVFSDGTNAIEYSLKG